MPKQETAKAADKDVSAKPEDSVTVQATQALQVTGDGDVSGPLDLALSPQAQDALMLELNEALHQVTEGFQTLTKPGDIFALAQPFDVVDAITINDFVDRKTGEEKVKHIFKLEFPDGRVMMTMQSDARPRRVLASAFQKARALGRRVRVGPYLYESKKIEGQIQPAFIFTQQAGFQSRVES